MKQNHFFMKQKFLFPCTKVMAIRNNMAIRKQMFLRVPPAQHEQDPGSLSR